MTTSRTKKHYDAFGNRLYPCPICGHLSLYEIKGGGDCRQCQNPFTIMGYRIDPPKLEEP